MKLRKYIKQKDIENDKILSSFHILGIISKKIRKIEKDIKELSKNNRDINDKIFNISSRLNNLECSINKKMDKGDFYNILEPFKKEYYKLYNENLKIKKTLRKINKK